MHSTEVVFFVIILVASVLIGTTWGAWTSTRVRAGRDLGTIMTVNWLLVAAFAVMAIAGAAVFFKAAAVSKIGWTMMICGGAVAVLLAGHHVTLRKLGRQAEERRMFASDL